MSNLNPPPSGTTFDWRVFKDWFFKLWKEFSNLTFGGGAFTYSAAVLATGGTETGNLSLVGPYIGMQAGNTSGQTIANNTLTTLTGWTTAFDTTSMFAASTGIYTVPVTGYYQVCGGMGYNSATWAAATACLLIIFQNSSPMFESVRTLDGAVTTTIFPPTVSGLLFCKAGDTISLQVLQAQGGNLTLYTGTRDLNTNYFTIAKVG